MSETTSETQYATITTEQLAKKLRDTPPNHENGSRGFALVNVLGRESFAREHIPGSINVPKEELAKLEERFDTEKEVIVYCASFDCDASPRAAETLARRGFRRVVDYEGGMTDWKDAGHDIARSVGGA
jgi:rhodanese-related sulfurtransferase